MAPRFRRALGGAVTGAFVATLGFGDVARADTVDDLARLAMERCIAPLSLGQPPEVVGLRPLNDVANSAFSDAAMTPDDRIALDPRNFRGLHECQIATDSRHVRLDPAAIEAAKATFDTLADRLVADGAFANQTITGPTEGIVGSFFVEEGDFLRRLASTNPVRGGLHIEVSLMTAAHHGEAAIVVSEHFGPPPEEVSLR